jgi:hypothetical protein
MRVGSLCLDARTAKGLYYAVVMFTVLVFFVGFCILLGVVMSPGAQDMRLSLWRGN